MWSFDKKSTLFLEWATEFRQGTNIMKINVNNLLLDSWRVISSNTALMLSTNAGNLEKKNNNALDLFQRINLVKGIKLGQITIFILISKK